LSTGFQLSCCDRQTDRQMLGIKYTHLDRGSELSSCLYIEERLKITCVGLSVMYSVLMLCHFIVSDDECVMCGMGIRGLMSGMATLPLCNQ